MEFETLLSETAVSHLIASLGAPYLLGLIIPGLVALFVRSQFVTGRRPSHKDNALSYTTISIIYYALILPLVDLVLPEKAGHTTLVIAWLSIVLIGPVALGFLLGVNIQKNLVRGLLRRWRINLVHTIPTAWDWKFSSLVGEQWVLVNLTDGTRVAGFFGSDSFASSSDLGERDLYIQETYDIDKHDNWVPHSPDGKSGVLIASDMIRTIEFWPFGPQEGGNVQK